MKKYLNILFFLLLISLKVSAVSVYLHECQEDQKTDNCEICEIAIYHQNAEFSEAQDFHNLTVDYTRDFPQIINQYKSVYKKTRYINKTIFGRPPPSLI